MVKPKYYDKKRLKVGEYFLFLLIGEALMIVGSIVGNIFSEIIGGIFGTANENSVNTVVTELPVWAIFIVVCVLAPIFEELIYRKLIMDRFGKIGGALAVLLSAIAFGLMHCNFYQLFYAVAVGIVFGYVYQRTHNILYTISMHSILNFIGSIVTIPILETSEKVEKMELILNSGRAVERSEYYLNYLLVTVYSLFQLAILAGGVTALVLYIVKKKRLLLWDLGKCPKQAVGASFANVGAILFFSLCIVLSLTNLIF
jgi:membrane protease YdiL (CAAX protease family)